MKKLHALVKVVTLDDEGQPLTFSPLGWASADDNLWRGASIVKLSENRCIVCLATGATVRMSIFPIPNSSSYVVSNDIKE